MKSTIHVSAEALRANLLTLQEAAGPDFEIFCVLKADAYGHGLALCAPVLVQAGARWLGVADLEEGVTVRDALAQAGLADLPVHVVTMCGFEPADAPGLVSHDLTPVVWTPEHIALLEAAAAPLRQQVAVHLELETGMARQGAAPGPALEALLEALRLAPHVRVEGIFSHLSSSEVTGSLQTARQLTRFRPALDQLTRQGLLPAYLHLGNSSALDEGATLPWVREVALQWLRAKPLVRPGLALYGYALPLSGAEHRAGSAALLPHLVPVATWTTHILDLRELAPGETVGYNATYTATRPMRVALLPIGYADGFRREASSGLGHGWVIVHGQPAPVVGRVSMNLTVVDVTNLETQPALGDEVMLLGPGVTAHDHACWAGTIPYEILCGLRGHRRLR